MRRRVQVIELLPKAIDAVLALVDEPETDLVLHRLAVIERRRGGDPGRSWLAILVSAWPTESVDVYDAAVSTAQDWKPSREITTKDVVLCPRVRAHYPQSVSLGVATGLLLFSPALRPSYSSRRYHLDSLTSRMFPSGSWQWKTVCPHDITVTG